MPQTRVGSRQLETKGAMEGCGGTVQSPAGAGCVNAQPGPLFRLSAADCRKSKDDKGIATLAERVLVP